MIRYFKKKVLMPQKECLRIKLVVQFFERTCTFGHLDYALIFLRI